MLLLSTDEVKSKGDVQKEIDTIEAFYTAERFYDDVLMPNLLVRDYRPIDPGKFDPVEMAKVSPRNLSWDEYLVKTKMFTLKRDSHGRDWNEELKCIVNIDGVISYSIPISADENMTRIRLYKNGVQKIDTKKRTEILKEMLIRYT